MGHYWSEMRGHETPLERLQAEAREIAERLRLLPTSRFSVTELGLLLRVHWSRFQDAYYEADCHTIQQMGIREGVTIRREE